MAGARRRRGSARPPTEWMKHLMRVYRSMPKGTLLSQAMVEARRSYRR
jgi:hypothetical protein